MDPYGHSGTYGIVNDDEQEQKNRNSWKWKGGGIVCGAAASNGCRCRRIRRFRTGWTTNSGSGGRRRGAAKTMGGLLSTISGNMLLRGRGERDVAAAALSGQGLSGTTDRAGVSGRERRGRPVLRKEKKNTGSFGHCYWPGVRFFVDLRRQLMVL